MRTEHAAAFAQRWRAQNIRSRVDAVTAEVVRELRTCGVRPLLLKGPVLGSLLYDDDSQRVYVDSDLLVAPSEHAAAERCLARLGFRQVLADSDVPGSELAGQPWGRADGASVDLHRTISDAGATPAAVWSVVSESTRTLAVGGIDVEAPGVPMCAALVALHAAHHGRRADKPLEDLALAIDRLDVSIWAAAARLAARLGATNAFASGLMLHPAGRGLAAELSLPTELPRVVRLKGGRPPPGALTLDALASTRGLRQKFALIARKLVPTRRFMLVWFPRSALGGRWMLAAYLWRPVWLALQLVPALRAWRAATPGVGD